MGASMSAWKTHLVWGVLTVVIAAAWGQHVASRKEREFDAERTAGRLNRRAPVAAPASEPALVPVSSIASADASPSPATEPARSKPKTAPAKKEERPIEELLQSGDKGDVLYALRAID